MCVGDLQLHVCAPGIHGVLEGVGQGLEVVVDGMRQLMGDLRGGGALLGVAAQELSLPAAPNSGGGAGLPTPAAAATAVSA